MHDMHVLQPLGQNNYIKSHHNYNCCVIVCLTHRILLYIDWVYSDETNLSLYNYTFLRRKFRSQKESYYVTHTCRIHSQT